MKPRFCWESVQSEELIKPFPNQSFQRTVAPSTKGLGRSSVPPLDALNMFKVGLAADGEACSF